MPKLTKTTMKPEDFDGQEPVKEIQLEIYDTRKNHNKFWKCQVFGRYVVRRWGRHGTKGQSSVHSAWSDYEARDAFYLLTYQKEGKGYIKDETTVLDHMARKLD